MPLINIGCTAGNVTNIWIDKPFKEITYEDVRVHAKVGTITGWAPARRTFIKPGEPQPLPCRNCEDFMGYQVSTKIAISFIDVYDGRGMADGGFYADSQRTISEHKTTHCANCGEVLDFYINR